MDGDKPAGFLKGRMSSRTWDYREQILLAVRAKTELGATT